MSKKINVRTQHKIDTYENWSKAENFVPLKGELIIYTTDENGNEIVKLKIGDGETKVNDLPFAVGGSATDESGLAQIQSDWAQTDSAQPDYIKNKIGDYQKDLREFNDIAFGNYAGTTPFYMWNNVLSNIDTLKDLDEEVILNVYQNGNLIDSQKFLLNPTLDSSFLSSSETGYWVLINATKTTEEILGGSAWEKKNPDYSTFNMGFIKNNTTGIVYVIAGAPNDELVGQSFSFELDFTNTTKQLIKLPWEVISNKPGDISIGTFVDTYDLGVADDNDVTGDIYAVIYQGCNLPTANTINVTLTHKTSGDIINLGPCELATGNFSGTEVIQGGFNTNTLFTDLASGTATSFTRIDDTIPSGVIMFAEEFLTTMIGIDIADYADYELTISYEGKSIIGLPENTLGEEFENIDGKLTLTLGKTITIEKEVNNSYTTTLGTPDNTPPTTPFLIWNNVIKDKQIYDDIQDDTPIKVSYIENDETVEIGTYNLFSNSTLDTQFGMGSNNTGYYGLINAAQSLEEVLEGNWTRADLNKPTFTLVFAKSNTTGQSWLQIAAPEMLTGTTFIVEISTTETESRTIKLSNEAINVDEVPTEGSKNFLTSDAIKSALSSIDVELPQNVSYFTNDANYQNQEQVNESINIKANEIEGKIPTVPTKVSSFINDAGYLTEHQNLDAYALKTEIPTIPSDVSTFNNDANYQTDIDVSKAIDNAIGDVDTAIAQLEAMIGGASS